jgi:hypothetical protein
MRVEATRGKDNASEFRIEIDEIEIEIEIEG